MSAEIPETDELSIDESEAIEAVIDDEPLTVFQQATLLAMLEEMYADSVDNPVATHRKLVQQVLFTVFLAFFAYGFLFAMLWRASHFA